MKNLAILVVVLLVGASAAQKVFLNKQAEAKGIVLGATSATCALYNNGAITDDELTDQISKVGMFVKEHKLEGYMKEVINEFC